MSRIILTGATGMTGGETLRQLLAHPAVEKVTVLTRRPLTDPAVNTSPKLVTVIHNDFTEYNSIVGKLQGHDALIWCLGGKPSPDQSESDFIRINHDFPVNAAKALSHLSPTFRFCHVSGMSVTQNEDAVFPWQKITRNIKGRSERHLNDIHAAQPTFETYHLHPAGIIPPKATETWTAFAVTAAIAPFIVVKVEDLAEALIYCALNGWEVPKDRVIGNGVIKTIAAKERVAASS
ncbi:uncharacterized protein EV422DRAFT_167745 [Fimicolochytrium jonesii]|uniref:uncharacterized protein n=1 Tax=Fimicolochytrium jonesii TaxID=1396493 RepID=UPI0022FF2E6C|nr:uncharacterized protein EV422DRAFT_167745 [Fimicolochytrium jonesii]KAI8818465.1 hypothetical protein EV422DRAFT_167745 [Fimicolochytrium jonesii]